VLTARDVSERERDYIAAIEAFYKDSDKVDHKTRALAYEKAMETLAFRALGRRSSRSPLFNREVTHLPQTL
jgi:hypothetical protein